jgi:acetyl esterase/lipase
VPIRVYKDSSTASGAKLPVFIWFHGGGFCYGTLSSEDGYCSWIAEKAGIIVVNVCYRHTPEWKWPAQREDAFNALNWVFENIDKIGGDREKVLVGGRSSGSNLSAGIALRDKETVSPFRRNMSYAAR